MSSTWAHRGVLAIRDARALIAASAASQLGDWLYNAALLAYVYIATDSAAWVGAATICRLLHYALLGPVGGVIADRYNRKTALLEALEAAPNMRSALPIGPGRRTRPARSSPHSSMTRDGRASERQRRHGGRGQRRVRGEAAHPCPHGRSRGPSGHRRRTRTLVQRAGR